VEKRREAARGGCSGSRASCPITPHAATPSQRSAAQRAFVCAVRAPLLLSPAARTLGSAPDFSNAGPRRSPSEGSVAPCTLGLLALSPRSSLAARRSFAATAPPRCAHAARRIRPSHELDRRTPPHAVRAPLPAAAASARRCSSMRRCSWRCPLLPPHALASAQRRGRRRVTQRCSARVQPAAQAARPSPASEQRGHPHLRTELGTPPASSRSTLVATGTREGGARTPLVPADEVLTTRMHARPRATRDTAPPPCLPQRTLLHRQQHAAEEAECFERPAAAAPAPARGRFLSRGKRGRAPRLFGLDGSVRGRGGLFGT
jgi:hypothetical protein